MFFLNKKENKKAASEAAALEAARDIIKNADACLIYTGAGMGVDSNLDVFRGKEGLWEKFPDAKDLNLGFKDLANPNNYLKHPEVVIPFYLKRYHSYLEAEPHSGYYELFGFAENLPYKYFATTSNVDGLLKKTGFNVDNIHEEHGSIFKWQCSDYFCSRSQGLDGLVDIEDLDIENIDNIRCKKCNELLRPNICMFWDMNWFDSIYNRQENKYNNYYNRLLERKKVNVAVIEVGAGDDIRTMRSKAELAAYDFNTKLIRINPDKDESFVENDTIHINKGAAEGISDILKPI